MTQAPQAPLVDGSPPPGDPPSWFDAVVASPDVLVVTTLSGAYVSVSGSCPRVLGWSPEDLVGRHEHELVAAEDLPLLAEQRVALRRHPDRTATASYRVQRKDGSWVWVEATTRLGSAGHRTLAFTALRDVTDRQRRNLALQRQASTDPLTGVANRVVLLDRLVQAVRRLERVPGGVAVLALDLDRFKRVNDGLGHAAGDEVLLQVASRVRAHLRPTDTLARLGGDEFVVVVEGNVDAGVIGQLAARILEAGRHPFHIGGQPVTCTMSLGVASTSDARCDPDQLLRNADLALYRAKEEGRDRTEFFDDALRRRASWREGIERMLREALRDGRVGVRFQPVTGVRTGRVEAVDALLWLSDPDGSPIHPDEFLDVAEETGLLVDLDEIVMTEAVSRAAAWNRSGTAAGVEVCVSLTGAHLVSASVHESLLAHVGASGLDPRRLGLVLPEAVLQEQASSTSSGLRDLRAAGIRIGVEGIGASGSSLSSLQALPVDFVRLHPAVVARIPDDPVAVAVVTAAITVAGSLGLPVSAPEVTSPEQLAMLIALGCDRVQGDLLWPKLQLDDVQAALGHSAAG